MTELIRPIVDLRPNTIIEFRLSSKQTVISKFQKLTLDGIEYRKDEALEYLEIKSNQQATPIEFIKQGQSVSLQLGQYLTTVDKLTTTFNWTQKKVRYWLAKWQKQGILSCQVVKNKLGHKIGTLITLNNFQEFRNQLGIQFKNYTENQKKLSQNWGGRFIQFNQVKLENGANKLIKGNTYKNNIENHNPNSLIFEANKKLYQINSKILEEKRKQEEELLILKNSLKKEKTKNNQLKSMKRFEVKGQVKSDKVKFDWSFQDTQEFKMICDKLKTFGFEQYTINKIWWKHSGDITRLIDYIDYTQMKYEQGKVADRKKFLYHALQASYDIGELKKMRLEARSQEEKFRIEEEKRAGEYRLKKEARIEIEKQRLITANQQTIVCDWINQNQKNVLFEEVYEELKNAQHQFYFEKLIRKARELRMKPIEVLNSGMLSYGELICYGIWYKVLEIAGVEINVVC